LDRKGGITSPPFSVSVIPWSPVLQMQTLPCLWQGSFVSQAPSYKRA
jgi:hypothetical protein